jgi:truncated hemoglobin YjbI
MKHALNDVVDDQALRDELYTALYGVADFMRNQPESTGEHGCPSNKKREPYAR